MIRIPARGRSGGKPRKSVGSAHKPGLTVDDVLALYATPVLNCDSVLAQETLREPAKEQP